MDHHIVRAIDPKGGVHFISREAPGLTQERAEAFVFNNAPAAHYSAYSARYGDPHAFWESERRSAALTAAARKGWAFAAEPL
jgi:hypothetical protein